MSDWTPIPDGALQPLAEPITDANFRLWRDAPRWRTLTLSAIGFTAALLTLPFVSTSPDESMKNMAACQGNPTPFAGASGRGEVVGFLTSDQALRLLQNTQFTSRMAINPDYVGNVRSLVHLDGSIEGSRFVYIVPREMNVRVGDRVEVVGGHLDTSLPCHYIPNSIAGIQPQ